ncbi:Ig-like domain-containing protein [Leucobacter luti]|uniref:Ig-like domain-containing protein n=1 Tax=Leucobacter luti TaxID=340320 RepID=UPI001C690A95|nr:Ig-like domain-containing protein [Leucobacter luti]QYM76311.1 Ig-like domain-containing protein [Leucobacter luti]
MTDHHSPRPSRTSESSSSQRPTSLRRAAIAGVLAVGLVGTLSWIGVSASGATSRIADEAYLNIAFAVADVREITVSGKIDGIHGTVPTGTVALRCGTVELGTQELANGTYTFTFDERDEWGSAQIECRIAYAGDHNHQPSEILQLVDLTR